MNSFVQIRCSIFMYLLNIMYIVCIVKNVYIRPQISAPL